MSLKNSVVSNGSGEQSLSEEQRAKINEIRASLGQLPDKLSIYCSDSAIQRYLTARNWNVKKASKMLKETLKWRLDYKPEEIRWEEIAHEAETGKIYRSNFVDKHGRSVLVMRPARQNTNSTKGQIKYLVYCMENAILNLPANQEQMVWLIDFHGFNMSHISVKVTKETAHILQDRYPERLGLAILYNAPKFFEPFWMVVKPFLERKTYNKVKFVYPNDHNSLKIMEEHFDMDKLESSFGGNSQVGFNITDYAARMREDDTKMPIFWSRGNSSETIEESAIPSIKTDSETDPDKPVKEDNTGKSVKEDDPCKFVKEDEENSSSQERTEESHRNENGMNNEQLSSLESKPQR
ncbi:random slug protein 5-like [Iris pallida]|uniref:Random slug protein 5-like n=1 Tax=Iris pallida TaxID=29817 RepID=A0AAX6I2Z5_IRIPA|nr:random slug protein 5-like [Iris pallida]